MNTREFDDECYLQEMAALDGQSEGDRAVALFLRADSVEAGEAEFQAHTVSRRELATWLRARAEVYQ